MLALITEVSTSRFRMEATAVIPHPCFVRLSKRLIMDSVQIELVEAKLKSCHQLLDRTEVASRNIVRCSCKTELPSRISPDRTHVCGVLARIAMLPEALGQLVDFRFVEGLARIIGKLANLIDDDKVEGAAVLHFGCSS